MNETEFWSAMRRDPFDSLVRLAYADWLDEEGDPKGEFQRLCACLPEADPLSIGARVMRARRDRMCRSTILAPWRESLRNERTDQTWWRGLLLSAYTLSAISTTISRALPTIPAAGCLHEGTGLNEPFLQKRHHNWLSVLDWRAVPENAADAIPEWVRSVLEHVAVVRLMDESGVVSVPDLANLFPDVQQVAVTGFSTLRKHWKEGLSRLRHFAIESLSRGVRTSELLSQLPSDLESLRLSACLDDDSGTQSAWEHAPIQNLKHLDIRGAHRAIVDSPGTTPATELSLFSRLPWTDSLQSLAMAWWYPPSNRTRWLHAPPPDLRRMALQVRGEGLDRWLLQFSEEWASQLTSLSLSVSSRRTNMNSCGRLVRSEALKNLELRAPLTAEFVENVATSRLPGQLETLSLVGCRMEDEHVSALLKGSWPQLRSLDLRNNSLTDASVQRLLSSTLADRLQVLLLSGNRITGECLPAIASTIGTELRILSVGQVDLTRQVVGKFLNSALPEQLDELAMTSANNWGTIPHLRRAFRFSWIGHVPASDFWPFDFWMPSLKSSGTMIRR